MLVEFLKAKIHGAKITQTDLHYVGSITIDENLMKAAGILPNEKVAVANFNNGNRFETYVIKGKAGSGIIGLNGPAALLGDIGQKITILSYCLLTPKEAKKHTPVVVQIGPKNKMAR